MKIVKFYYHRAYVLLGLCGAVVAFYGVAWVFLSVVRWIMQ